MKKYLFTYLAILSVSILLTVDGSNAASEEKKTANKPKVVAVETFLADIAQQIAGERLRIAILMSFGTDPHSFEPTPGDVRKVADCDVLLVNGSGFEPFLDKLLQNAGGVRLIIEASAGLAERSTHEERDHHHEGDPHFWLSPDNTTVYVQNIQRGLSEADPDGTKIYGANADAYIRRLKELDRWISDQVALVPPGRRLLVTNHESLGYFADRYGFRIIGTIVPSASTDAAPSAKQLAELAKAIKATGAKAVFLETGTNPQLARQLAEETGINVVNGLYTHSISDPSGPAPNYIEMMRCNTTIIVNALK